MTILAPSPDMVALVQVATSLPTLLLSLAAGALADMWDRRLVFMVGQAIVLIAAAALAALSFLNLLGAWALLALTFFIGVGSALRQPAYQASVAEMVPRPMLPAAIAMNSLGFNIGRSVGPAIGGTLVATVGAAGAFLFNALSNVGIVLVLFLQRRGDPERPNAGVHEGLGHAMLSGLRWTAGDRVVRAMVLRVVLFTFCGSAVWALLPLIAKHDLGGDAFTLGLLVGSLGVGAVLAAAMMPAVRARIGVRRLVAASALAFAGASITASFLHRIELLAPVLVVGGMGWLSVLSTYNTVVQTTAPGWVRARALSIYLMGLFAGIAAGSWTWGWLATWAGVPVALKVAGTLGALVLAVTYRLPMPDRFEPRP
jgi:MFS family permease